MEFHELLENEKFKAAIGPEKLALYLGEGGEELFEEDYSEALEDADNVVLEIFISAGDETGCLDIHKWGGFYISQFYATGTTFAPSLWKNTFGGFLELAMRSNGDLNTPSLRAPS